MNINKNFPIYKKGDMIEVDPKEQYGATLVKVFKTWYPKEGDTFNEADEIRNLGYLMSKPKAMFPQLVCIIKESNNPLQLIKGSDGRNTLICLQGDEYNKLHS